MPTLLIIAILNIAMANPPTSPFEKGRLEGDFKGVSGVKSLMMFLNFNHSDSTIVEKPDYMIDGVSGLLGGLIGFGVTIYVTSSFFASTKIGSVNYALEMGYVLGYALGMPLGFLFYSFQSL